MLYGIAGMVTAGGLYLGAALNWYPPLILVAAALGLLSIGVTLGCALGGVWY